MARTLTPVDAQAIMEELVKQATGQNSFGAVNTSNFASAGELVLASGVENTLNALSLLIGRTLIASRPYTGKLGLINAIDQGAYTDRLRKISYYSDDPENAGDFNTNMYTNLYDGYDNGTNSGASVGSMFVQRYKTPLEINFGGSAVWDYTLTIPEYQLKKAFRNEADFAQFIGGMMTEMGNDIESEREAWNRLTLLNFMAGIYDMGATGSLVNMTTVFNTWYGTNYNTATILESHLTEFLEIFVSEFKKASDLMTYRTAMFHSFPALTGKAILRHTPKEKQKVFMYADFFRKAEAIVKPAIFNPEYLDFGKQAELVEYWQGISSPSSISVTPAIPDFDSTSPTYGTQIAGSAVAEDMVLGVLFDEEACMTCMQADSAGTSPLEVRKMYRNLVNHFHKLAISDMSENGIIFYMNDDDVTP